MAKAGAGVARGELLDRILILGGGGGRHVTRPQGPWAGGNLGAPWVKTWGFSWNYEELMVF